jgi:methylenetetrahydrofolate dehydrogenase (NADP+)/methenyltetrahydrofolate cyclohydrolase
MALMLSGKPVVDSINSTLINQVAELKHNGIEPTLAIIRVGERDEDIAYERSIINRCKKIGIGLINYILAINSSQGDLLKVIEDVNKNEKINGCLLFRPIPNHIDYDLVRRTLSPDKDVDGITDVSLSGVFAGRNSGFPPCTPQACMQILDYYGIHVEGKKAAVIGRSLVVGKPVAMMLIKKNATVTICHTKTNDLASICRLSDIIIAAAGVPKMMDKDYFNSDQVVLDVGINIDDEGNLCGDVNFEDAWGIVRAVTPVPGGIGTVTTSVLAKHVVEAAYRVYNRRSV